MGVSKTVSKLGRWMDGGGGGAGRTNFSPNISVVLYQYQLIFHSSTAGVIQRFAPNNDLKHTPQQMGRVTLIRTSHLAVWTWVVGNEKSR
jgi:hypothetical protein